MGKPPRFVRDWFFPRLGGGEEAGLNDAGVETFKKGVSLGRETIQNIGDARSKAAIEDGKPALAEFDLLHIPTNKIPGHRKLESVFRSCADYIPKRFKSMEDQKANGLLFFKRGLKLLESDVIPTLRIRDRNTTGLSGTDSEEDKNAPWWRLIRGQGYASHEGVGGGTYGIGQRAPFAFSDLRTVIYYTRLPNKEEALVAKAILCSFPHPDHKGELTQNKGWYCKRQDKSVSWSGIRDPEFIPQYYRRSEVGTDLYILGYRPSSSWKQELRRSIAKNFFAAIHSGALEVRIDGGGEMDTLTAETISTVVQAEAGVN